VRSGKLQKCAESLEAPRTVDSDKCPHDRRKILRRDHHQAPLRNARESSQSRSSRPAGVADMSERSFGEFTAKPAELLA
jgi:hypothetical protein